MFGSPLKSLMIYDVHINDEFQFDETPKLLIKLDDLTNPTINFSCSQRDLGYETKDSYILQTGRYLIVLKKEFE